jgi:hypothetical protein
LLLLALGAAVLWLLWPLLRPALVPARGGTLVVVFDGYHRLDAALTHTPAEPLLLITCPRTGQPTTAQRQRLASRPFWRLQQGVHSAQQLTALSRWLQQPPAVLPPIGRVLLVSDRHHLPRLLPAARLALGGQGLRVSALLADADVPVQLRPPQPGPVPIARDWLRLQLWRATGSTGAELAPAILRRKHAACFFS